MMTVVLPESLGHILQCSCVRWFDREITLEKRLIIILGSVKEARKP
jgi:hypothetical protein